jgi:hypothetical protein
MDNVVAVSIEHGDDRLRTISIAFPDQAPASAPARSSS